MSAVPAVAGVPIGPTGTGRPLLLLGPGDRHLRGHAVGPLRAALAAEFEVLGWDLPGHGGLGPGHRRVLARRAGRGRARAGRAGPAVLLRGRLDRRGGRPAAAARPPGPGHRGRAVLHRGQDRQQRELAASGRRWSGPRARRRCCRCASQTWFGPGFADREPAVAAALLDTLAGADDASYAWGCEALAGLRRHRAAGRDHARRCSRSAGGTTPGRRPTGCAAIATRASRVAGWPCSTRSRTSPRPRRRAPPRPAVAGHLRARAGTAPLAEVQAAGNAVRRQVLGDAHVDRAAARTTDLDRDFQDFIERYAWGSIWTRPGLDRRSRSMVVLTALVARGHHEELAMHLRAARTNGLTVDGDRRGAAADRRSTAGCRTRTPRSGSPAPSWRRSSDRGVRLRRGPDPVRPARRGAGRRPARTTWPPSPSGPCWTARPGWTRRRSTRCCSATPTAPARRTATSAGWPRCWPGCRSRCRARR